MINAAEKSISLLCVDDNVQLCNALERKFETLPGFHWKGSLNDASNLVSKVAELSPSIVILDIDMPGRDPFEAASELTQHFPETRVVVFSGHTNNSYLERAIEAGVWAYVSKNDGEQALIQAIGEVMRDRFALSPQVRSIFEAGT